jgi:hypothetical protein
MTDHVEADSAKRQNRRRKGRRTRLLKPITGGA